VNEGPLWMALPLDGGRSVRMGEVETVRQCGLIGSPASKTGPKQLEVIRKLPARLTMRLVGPWSSLSQLDIWFQLRAYG
jgi:hypothetical protein